MKGEKEYTPRPVFQYIKMQKINQSNDPNQSRNH